jgi:hypothetical protein
MPSNWINWVKSYAAEHHLSYACALSQSGCKESYRAKYGVAKKVPQKVERERMGAEDVNIKPAPRRKPAAHSKEAFKMAAEDIRSHQFNRPIRENYRMAAEEAHSVRYTHPIPPAQDYDFPLEDIYHHEPAIAAPPAKRKGRKPKYSTKEEAAIAKRQQTLASNKFKNKERSSEKKERKKMELESVLGLR